MILFLLVGYILLFPYVTFGFFESDLSPFLIFATVFLYVTTGVKKEFLFLIVSFCFLTFLIFLEIIVNNNLNQSLKFCSSYMLGVMLFDIGFYVVSGLESRRIKIYCVLWIFLTIIASVYPEVAATLLFRVGSDESRGIVGLTPEPSLLGVMTVGYLLLIYRSQVNAEWFYPQSFIFITLLIIASLSKSMYAYAYLCAGLMCFPFKRKWSIIFIAIAFSSLLLFVDEESRVYLLAISILDSYEYLLQDQSSYLRLNALFAAVDLGVVQNFFGTFLMPSQELNSDSGLARLFNIEYTNNSIYAATFGGLTYAILRYGILGALLSSLYFLYFFRRIKLFSSNAPISATLGAYALFLLMIFVGPLVAPALLVGYGTLLNTKLKAD